MLKKLLGVIDSARQAFTSDTGLIREALSGISHIDAALGAQAAGFVVTGDRPEVLLALRANSSDLGTALGQPGRVHWQLHTRQLDAAVRVVAQTSLAARNKLYQRVGDDDTHVAMLVRLGKVLEAADHGQHLDHTGASMPEWLQYLLNDALWATLPHEESFVYSSNPVDSTPALVVARPAWDVRLIAALLAHDGFHQAMALPIVFERRGVDAYVVDRVYLRLLAPGALDDYMAAHPDDVPAASAVLSAAGRTLLVNRVGAVPALRELFADLIVKLAGSDSSTVRAAAARHVAELDPQRRASLLGALLVEGATGERANAAELLARTHGKDAIATLDAALASEKSKPVQQAMRGALSRLRAADDVHALTPAEPPPLPPAPTEVLGDDAIDLLLANRVELLEMRRLSAEQEAAANQENKRKWTHQRDSYERYQSITAAHLRTAINALNGGGNAGAAAVLANPEVSTTLSHGGRLEARPDFGMLQMLRWVVATGRNAWGPWYRPQFQAWVQRELKTKGPDSVDLRQLAALTEACGGDGETVVVTGLRSTWNIRDTPQAMLAPERVWPVYADRPDLIDAGLGMAATPYNGQGALDLGCTLSILATFPVVPPRWLPRMLELALGEGKTHRAAAQHILARLPDIGTRVCDALQSNKQEVRAEAARWLVQLGYKAGVPALYTALAKETRETVSAALLTALEQLGEDLSAYLAPAKLLAQAQKSLKTKAPSGMAWLDLASLPACTWDAGGPVEPEIIRWWIILAVKLKEPGGNALLERYLRLLAPASRAALGRWVLHQFIAHDTDHPPLAEGIAHAQAQAAQRHQDYQRMAQQWPQYYEAKGKLTPEQVFEEVKYEKMGEYLGTAIGEKGLLALVAGTPGAELVGAIQSYMRDHYQRRAQVEALIEAASSSDQPTVIQFVLAVSRRYRTASVQEKARMLVQRIADRNGWTADQLADRTVPTGGLDDTGRLVLQYGSRQYAVTLDAAMKPVLMNEDGKAVAALPAPRQDDPPESIKEAKSLFATCKKEVKQVVDMQRARLYEAMCAGRAWPVAEWREFLLEHPIVGRLVQRLVWLEVVGDTVRAFRPTEDGSLIDAADDEVALDDTGTIRMAHASLLSSEAAAAWVGHCKDYKITPLFIQMTRPLPNLPTPYTGHAIDDRRGWISDAFTLRGAFTKLGYQRGAAEDGGVFYEYRKDFGSTGLTVVMEFSGNALPEENLPAALKTLSFRQLNGGRYNHSAAELRMVPPVLLAEAYADYHAVAAASTGFDAAWEKKMPW